MAWSLVTVRRDAGRRARGPARDLGRAHRGRGRRFDIGELLLEVPRVRRHARALALLFEDLGNAVLVPRALLVSPDGLLGAARPDLAVIAVMARLAHPVVAHVWAASASRVVALRCTTDELLARADVFLSVYTSELCPDCGASRSPY